MFDSTLNIGIFSGVVVVILVIVIFEYRNKFKKPTFILNALGLFKYLLLIITLKPILTFIIYPGWKVIPKSYGGARWIEPRFNYHIENIFTYELIAFLYSFVLVLLVYLFIPKKKKSE
jgi:hypothetical protein